MDGMADFHSHILPGVDDGMRNMDKALEALDCYADNGVTSVWLTPHIMEDYPNTPELLRARFAELQEAYNEGEDEGKIELHLAAEHMLDTLFTSRLEEGGLMPFDGNHLLVETSYFNPPTRLYELFEDIMHRGYRPILAHPERYLYMSPDDYERLHSMGVVLQLNLPSVAGAYGPDPQARAEKLLKKGYYSIVGSDIHSLRATMSFMHRPIKESLARRAVELIQQQTLEH